MQLVLSHQRGGETYSGRVERLVEPDAVKLLHRFEDISFREMILRYSFYLKDYPTAEAVFQRTENPYLKPYTLDQAAADLIRENPVEAVEQMSPPPVMVHVDRSVKVEDSVKINVRAGHDTLADAFGDEVYVKMRRGGMTECPACGRWKALSQGSNGYGIMFCKGSGGGCMMNMPVRFIPLEWGGWVAMKTSILLDVGEKAPLERYYIPRAWNESGPWISHADLQQKYDAYLKEKEDASSSR